jgi:hypothetical protein
MCCVITCCVLQKWSILCPLLTVHCDCLLLHDRKIEVYKYEIKGCFHFLMCLDSYFLMIGLCHVAQCVYTVRPCTVKICHVLQYSKFIISWNTVGAYCMLLSLWIKWIYPPNSCQYFLEATQYAFFQSTEWPNTQLTQNILLYWNI